MSLKWAGYLAILVAGLGGVRGYYWMQEPAAPTPPPSEAAKMVGTWLATAKNWKVNKTDKGAFVLVNDDNDLTVQEDGTVSSGNKPLPFTSVASWSDKKYLAAKYIEARNTIELKALMPKEEAVAAVAPEPAKKETAFDVAKRLISDFRKPSTKKVDPESVHPLVKTATEAHEKAEENSYRVQTIEEQLTQVEEANRQLREKVEALVKANDESSQDYIKQRLLIMALNAKLEEVAEKLKKAEKSAEQLPAPKEAE
jgi:hypothetical protein